MLTKSAFYSLSSFLSLNGDSSGTGTGIKGGGGGIGGISGGKGGGGGTGNGGNGIIGNCFIPEGGFMIISP